MNLLNLSVFLNTDTVQRNTQSGGIHIVASLFSLSRWSMCLYSIYTPEYKTQGGWIIIAKSSFPSGYRIASRGEVSQRVILSVREAAPGFPSVFWLASQLKAFCVREVRAGGKAGKLSPKLQEATVLFLLEVDLLFPYTCAGLARQGFAFPLQQGHRFEGVSLTDAALVLKCVTLEAAG